jgi:hypothetical protein
MDEKSSSRPHDSDKAPPANPAWMTGQSPVATPIAHNRAEELQQPIKAKERVAALSTVQERRGVTTVDDVLIAATADMAQETLEQSREIRGQAEALNLRAGKLCDRALAIEAILDEALTG